MSWVADASWTAALFLPDEDSEAIGAQIEMLGDDSLLVPELWWYETTNILRGAERRGRLLTAQAARIFSLLGELPIVTDEQIGMLTARSIHDIAMASGLSAYDAAYVELALRRECALATLDDAVARAARALGVAVRD